ncbi:MAG: PaaI family thioesterase [bacterium]|nr:PaaI family thioesterase [bacterium]
MKPKAQPQSRCVVCGPDNPRGLRIRFQQTGDGAVEAVWVPTADWEGFEGVIHGGILSTVLDEAMSKAVVAAGWKALTGELKVRYRQPVKTGEELSVVGWVLEKRRRRITAEASLCGPDGLERVHAWGTFFEVG